MILQASDGHFLTESYEVSIKDRQFLSQINVANLNEASLWKEITKIEKEQMIALAQLLEVENVDYDYLTKVDTLLSSIAKKINDLHLNAEEAFKTKRLFPRWEDKIGEDVTNGFRMQRENYLFEVVIPHRVSVDTDPLKQLATPLVNPRPLIQADEGAQQEYYKLVTGNI